MHLDSRPIRGFTHPYVEIFALSGLEEEHIVAIVEFGKLIELIKFGLGVELCIFPTVWEQRVEIVEKMSVSVGHAPRAEDEDSLLILNGRTVSRRYFGGCRFRQRLVDGGHVFLGGRAICTAIVWCSSYENSAEVKPTIFHRVRERQRLHLGTAYWFNQ